MNAYTAVLVAHDTPRQMLAELLALRQFGQPSRVLLLEPEGVPDLSQVTALAGCPVQRLAVPAPGSLGAAFNAGLDQAPSEVVLLLHRALLQKDVVPAAALLADDESIGVVGAKLFVSEPPPRRVWQAGYRLTPGRVAPLPTGRWEWDTFHRPAEADAVSAACMLVRRTSLRFDERYWFELEDVDLCLQYRQRGLRVVLHPELQAVRLGALPGQPAAGPAAKASSVARLVAGRLLYHQRWCSGLPLASHPFQLPARGELAAAHFQAIERQSPA